MAKQTGIVPLAGTLGGINFYMRKGKPVARRAGGGFTGEAIRKSPSMARVRENNTEFGHCSRVKKVFKDSLLPFLGRHRNEELQGRLMRLFLAIKDADQASERGRRHIGVGLEYAAGKALLEGFCFTPFCLPTHNCSHDAATATYTLHGLDPKGLDFMPGATHLELQFGVVALDLEALKASLYSSEVVRVAKKGGVQSISLPADVPQEATGIRIGVLHYRFSQEVNGAFYGFQEQDGFGLKVVWVE